MGRKAMKTSIFPGSSTWVLAILCIAACLFACARATYYRVNLHYVPQKSLPAADNSMHRFIMTVAGFNDERNVLDKSSIGKKVKSDGSEMKAISQQMPASAAVGAAIKDFFFKHGYTLYGGMPDWDLNEKAIDSQWGSLLVGGAIEELNIVCNSDFANVQYEATVRLRIVFADVHRKKIVYTRTLESSSTFKHVRFKEEKMEDEINNALSTAVEKIFDDNKVEELIQDVQRVRSESLKQ
ncbi:MAG: hypothetical protein WCQ99_14205 [Pseudomonadota bacterium]